MVVLVQVQVGLASALWTPHITPKLQLKSVKSSSCNYYVVQMDALDTLAAVGFHMYDNIDMIYFIQL